MILNLVNSEAFDINYQVSHFPDGQQNIRIDSVVYPDTTPITIYSRFNSFRDLELIICATKSLRRKGIKNISLFIPYLLGARSDRQFEHGGNSYLVDVIAPIINAQGFECVQVMDVHSDVAAACINNLVNVDNSALFGFVRRDGIFNEKNSILVSPDAGALKKVYNIADKFDYKDDVIVCSKSRDTEGKLTKTIVPLNSLEIFNSKSFIIIDDICDGGRTFINIAKEIVNWQDRCSQLRADRGKIYLVVTHGIFSAGFEELDKYFDGIYTTNSIKDLGDSYTDSYGKVKQHKVKQLNIFK